MQCNVLLPPGSVAVLQIGVCLETELFDLRNKVFNRLTVELTIELTSVLAKPQPWP